MKSFNEFFNEGIVYDDHEPGSGFRRKSTSFGLYSDNVDPHHHWGTHYGNMMHLSFVHKNSNDPREKIQASKELDTANKKMAFWEKHPNFDKRTAIDTALEIKKKWEPPKPSARIVKPPIK